MYNVFLLRLLQHKIITLVSSACYLKTFLITCLLKTDISWAPNERLIKFALSFWLFSEIFPASLLPATTIHHNLCAESNKSASNSGDDNSGDKNNACHDLEADDHCSKDHPDQHNHSALGGSTSSSQCLDHCTFQGPDSAERSAKEQ